MFKKISSKFMIIYVYKSDGIKHNKIFNKVIFYIAEI